VSSSETFASSTSIASSDSEMSPSSSSRTRRYATCRSAGVAASSIAIVSNCLAVSRRLRSTVVKDESLSRRASRSATSKATS
jgi:hypothetical protein